MKRKGHIIMILLFLFMQVYSVTIPTAYAKMKIGTPISLTAPGQILESITYNGITVEAAYTNGPYSGSDPIYSCAAFVKKFYSMVYGIGVYNLISKDSIPLVYNNMGSFSLTTQPQVGDIVRDNTRTHWAIVKSVTEDIITVVQQNYRSGNNAWINCTIDRSDADYSYFTYSNRVDDRKGDTDNTTAGSGEVSSEIITDADLAFELQEGTYRLIHSSSALFVTASEELDGWRAKIGNYQDSDSQMLSIVSLGKAEYAVQFLSDRRFLSISDKNEIITSEHLDHKFVFVLRANGNYTLSPANNRNKVIAYQQDNTQNSQSYLVLQDYIGSANEFWNFGMMSSSVLTLSPAATVNKKTLYLGYKDFSVGIDQLKYNAAVTYTSGNPAVAEVSEPGVIKPIGIGETTIYIQVHQDSVAYQLQVNITVKKPSIKIEASNKRLPVGESIGLKVKKYGTKSAVTWQVSNKNIAVIDKNNTLIAKKKGTVTITAKTKDGLTAKIKLTII